MSNTSSWLRIVGLHAELAAKRACGAALDDVACSAARAALMELERRGASASPRSPFAELAARLGLSMEEQLVAWCLVGHQLDTRLGNQLEGLAGSSDLTVGALAAVAYPDDIGRALVELGVDGRLFKFALVERVEDPKTESSWARRVVRGNDRLLEIAIGAGNANLDRSLTSFALLSPKNTAETTPAGEALTRARQAMTNTRAIVVVSGMLGLGRRTLLTTAAREAGIGILQIDARRLSKDPATLQKHCRALARECKLFALAPLITNIDALVDDKESRLDVLGTELVAPLDGLALATCGVNRPAIKWDRPTIVIEMHPPTSEQRGKLWLNELGQGSESDAELLATQYPLAPALIHHAAEAARALASGRALRPEDIYEGIRTVLDDRLGHHAKRVTVTQTWDDLVLPQEQVDSIVELMARVRGRRQVYERWGFASKVGKGLGVSALFSGPPGTGKTMVAALIARDLGLELYQVDLGKVVSKWIGETEKNLASLFDAAEAGHAVLLFDEADALFGKRTEVKSSNDRYANLETNYLLQRLESFSGICLLTSNHESNIDPAFLRRLSLHLRFEMPDLEERLHLWRAMLPEAAPVAADVDFDGLARRYAMSGGYIRNAALRAAFLAADEAGAITAAHLERAAKLEYEGLGKIAA